MLGKEVKVSQSVPDEHFDRPKGSRQLLNKLLAFTAFLVLKVWLEKLGGENSGSVLSGRSLAIVPDVPKSYSNS
ncbi:hypothetical protein GH733_007016, partial [Mirounga leonina]